MMDFSFLTAMGLKADKPARKPVKKRPANAKKTPLKTCQIGEIQLQIKSHKRRKSLALKIQNQQPVLAVPSQLTAKQLDQLIAHHYDWIASKLKQINQQLPERFQALPDQQFEFKGQNIVCQPHHGKALNIDLINNSVQFGLYAECPIKQQQLKFKALQKWFITEAENYLQPKIDFYAEQMALDYSFMQVKGYKSRWGSCYSDGRIQFNWRLMQAPEWVIDYVVVHELAHLKHHNHSKAFWQLVELHYPQTALAKQQLKQHGARWIDFLQN